MLKEVSIDEGAFEASTVRVRPARAEQTSPNAFVPSYFPHLTITSSCLRPLLEHATLCITLSMSFDFPISWIQYSRRGGKFVAGDGNHRSIRQAQCSLLAGSAGGSTIHHTRSQEEAW